jgi:SOUL heme-binding protein
MMFESAIYYGMLVIQSVVFGAVGIRLYEEPPYQIVETLPANVEIRRYAQRVAAEVTLPRGTDDRASGVAFQALFDYIAGANQMANGTGEKIAMTVPVEVRGGEMLAMTAPVQTAADDGMLRMQFFLPQRYTQETAPAPADGRVRIVTVPAQSIAALRFSGRTNDTAPMERKGQLMDALAGSNWRPTAEPVLLSYDAPFTIPFVRRNEVAVAVEMR